MALVERTRPYELFFRINADGTFGTSYKTIWELLNDGVVTRDTEGQLQPVYTVDDEGIAVLNTILGPVLTTAISSNETLQAQVKAAAQIIDQTKVQLGDAVSANQSLSCRIDEMEAIAEDSLRNQAAQQSEIDTLKIAAQAGQDNIKALQNEIERLNALVLSLQPVAPDVAEQTAPDEPT
jgi:DNA repair exonuclease SbcCD ATPase subunit